MISIKTNVATENDIVFHIERCEMKEKLIEEVNLIKYVKKVKKFSQRFEAWDGGKLVGMLAIYANNFEEKRAFVTHMGIDKDYRGQGVSSILMNLAINYAKSKSFLYIDLVVEKTNKNAYNLYAKYGFTKSKQKNSKIYMTKNI